MENASKALIMAGSVLIALMIIGALILTFSNITAYQETNTRSTRSTQMAEFNSQYETYNRKDVRGSDLYSLLNKAIDYNRRESTAGTNWADRGQEMAYEPMTITFTISNISELSADGTNRLFTSSTNEVTGKSNDFGDKVKDEIDDLEAEYGQSSLTNLTTNLTKIFIDGNPTDQEQKEAVQNFNSASKKKTVSSFSEINEKSQIRQDVYKYYEYIQFKRAYFNCTNVKYNSKTGRIISMEFEATGRLN